MYIKEDYEKFVVFNYGFSPSEESISSKEYQQLFAQYSQGSPFVLQLKTFKLNAKAVINYAVSQQLNREQFQDLLADTFEYLTAVNYPDSFEKYKTRLPANVGLYVKRHHEDTTKNPTEKLSAAARLSHPVDMEKNLGDKDLLEEVKTVVKNYNITNKNCISYKTGQIFLEKYFGDKPFCQTAKEHGVSRSRAYVANNKMKHYIIKYIAAKDRGDEEIREKSH